jgi:hypothetical protein
MVEVLHFTEEFRLEELRRADQSLFYFCRAHLGFDRLHEPHYELCSMLEGRAPYHPWIRGLVCAYRGSYKSTICTQGYPWWRALFIENFSAKIIESNVDNVKKNHFIPMVNLWTSSPRAAYLQWLYQHRLPEGLKGWNTEQIELGKTNPLAGPAISYWGVESRKEGWHGNLIVCDDLEGADAEDSENASETAYSVIGQCTPLLDEPARDQVLAVGTPWGRTPLMHRIKDSECEGKVDLETQKRRTWKVFWKPVMNDNGEVVEPKRFPPHVIKALSKEPLWETQYMLWKKRAIDDIFKEEAIKEAAFTWIGGKEIIEYQGFAFDIDKLDEFGHVTPPLETCRVNVQDLRTYLHCDPTHKLDMEMKTQKKSRPSEHAISIVGVAPDSHVFLLDYWSSKVGGLEVVVPKLMQMARKWNVHRATYESYGAQVWLPQFMEMYEKQQRGAWMRAISSGQSDRSAFMGAMHVKLEESEKGQASKEWIFRELLAPWVNNGILHFHLIDHAPVIHQLLHIDDESVAIDVVDAMSQGPEIWKPALAREHAASEFNRRKAYVQNVKKRGMQYHSPYRAAR